MPGEFKSEKYEFVDEKPLGSGMEAQVDLVKAKRGERVINLVRKRALENSTLNEAQIAERFKRSVETYKLLKDKGYPVPNVWRLDEKTQELFVSDLTKGGGCEVLDGRRLSKIYRHKEPTPLKLSEKTLEILKRQLSELGVMATGDNIAIPSDAWFVVIEKDSGNANIMLGDITGIKDMKGSGAEKKVIDDINKRSVDYFSHKLNVLT